jgi:hypothetical protein
MKTWTARMMTTVLAALASTVALPCAAYSVQATEIGDLSTGLVTTAVIADAVDADAVDAAAVDNVAPDVLPDGSITGTLFITKQQEDGTPLVGVFSLTQVQGIDLTSIDGWAAVDEMTVDQVAAQQQSGAAATRTTNAAGQVRFFDLAPGVYYISDSANPAVQPFIITVPMQDTDATSATFGTWQYTVHSYPKLADAAGGEDPDPQPTATSTTTPTGDSSTVTGASPVGPASQPASGALAALARVMTRSGVQLASAIIGGGLLIAGLWLLLARNRRKPGTDERTAP